MARGALIVDIRPEAQRASEGQLGFGVIVERNVFEWRFDLDGPDRLPEVQSRDQQVIVVCSEGYASSLAAAVLRELGYTAASDLVGGFRAWQALGEQGGDRVQGATRGFGSLSFRRGRGCEDSAAIDSLLASVRGSQTPAFLLHFNRITLFLASTNQVGRHSQSM